MKRPIGIATLSLLALAVSLNFIVFGLLFAAVPHILAPLGFKPNPAPLQRLLGLGFFAFVGGLLVHVAYSLWFLRPWGRSFATGVGWAGLGFAINEAIRGSHDYLAAGLISLGCALLLVYLSRPRVRSSFEALGDGN